MPAGETLPSPIGPLMGAVPSTAMAKLLPMLRLFVPETPTNVFEAMTVPLPATNRSYHPRLATIPLAPVARLVQPPPLAGQGPLIAIDPAHKSISLAAEVVRPGHVTSFELAKLLAAVCAIVPD